MAPEFAPDGIIFSNSEFEEVLDSQGVSSLARRRTELVTMRKAWGIEKCRIGGLIGLSAPEFFSRLPEYPWQVLNGGFQTAVEIKSFLTVDYDTQKPRQEVDLFGQILVDAGRRCLQEELKRQLETKTVGITSMVYVKQQKFVLPLHIPYIDLDIKGSNINLEGLKVRIREETEVKRGAFLSSGRSGHYHFVGLGRLLDQDDLITFLGRCLLIGDDIVDSRWVGHSLTPMVHHNQFVDQGSVYDFRTRFSTLRLSDSQMKPAVPKVVDVM